MEEAQLECCAKKFYTYENENIGVESGRVRIIFIQFKGYITFTV